MVRLTGKLTVCIYRGTESGVIPDEPHVCIEELNWQEPNLTFCYYWVQYVDIHGNLSEFSDEISLLNPTGVDQIAPATSEIYKNYPNPFNPSTTISFTVPQSSTVSLSVYDLSGRLIRSLLSDESVDQGRHEVVWSGQDERGGSVPSGVYFYRLETGGLSQTKRMSLVR
jgi:hypothetical protein